MKTDSAGPLGNRYAGKEYPVTAEEGQALVEGGFAEWGESEKRSEGAPVEVAMAPTPENAARQVGRRRR